MYHLKKHIQSKKDTHTKSSNLHILNKQNIYDSINQHMKEKLLLPQYKSFDPVYFATKIFKNCFVPSDKNFDNYKTSNNNDSNFNKKFSKYCFNKGTLASAILNNEGKVMMLAAYKQSLEHPSTIHQQNKVLYGSRMSSKNANHISIYYNQCYKSACGIVLNASTQANKVLSNLKKAIENDEERSDLVSNAFEDILPFISTKREVTLSNHYEDLLKSLKAKSQSPNITKEETSHIKKQIYILEKSVTKINTIIQKKNMQRLNFLASIQTIWDRLYQFEQNLTNNTIQNSTSPSSIENDTPDDNSSNSEDTSDILETENERV